ncbi:MAG: ankyrin repeat domain-containing protein [Gammaproteobacteria bacterium]
MTARLFAIFAFAFLAGCGGGVSVLPEPFTRERADGKIPVKTDLIREQVRAELDGVAEGEAEVARWQTIETDYNACRLSSARTTKSAAEEVFANCMSERGYVYMLPIDAEQFHNDIAAKLTKERDDRLAAILKAAEVADRWSKRLFLEDNLLVAARDGELSEVRQLLTDGVNPNAAADNGSTALMSAAYQGHAEIAEILLSAGAHPNAAADDGGTALMWAAGQGHTEVVNVLLSAGAHPNAADNNGVMALMAAAENGHAEIAKMLLSAGANPDAATDDGRTALMWAARDGHAEIAKILLSAGANPNAAADSGWTALAWAVSKVHLDIAEMLLEAKANPNHVIDGVYSVMDNAIYDNHPDMVQLLRRYGGVCRKNCR